VTLDDLKADRQPEPVPPPAASRVEKNGVKIRLLVWASMPIPLSATTMPIRSSSTHVETRSWPPPGMASMALLNRFTRTCLKASGSISRHGRSPYSSVIRTPASWVLKRSSSRVDLTRALRSLGFVAAVAAWRTPGAIE